MTQSAVIAERLRLRQAGLSLAWTVCGALGWLGLATLGTHVVLVLVAIAGIVLLALHTRSGPAVFGLISGAAIVPARIAWTRRCSPSSCENTADFGYAVYYASPWPYAAATAVLIALGLLGYAIAVAVTRSQGSRLS